MQHELTHVTQYHSIDKIVIQLNLIAGWFNPFFWLLKKELDMIHEFIADKKSVEHGDTASLAQMLLTTAYPGQQFPLTNPFFFSPIKRRLKMLTNVKNPSFSYARRIVVLPLLSIVVLLFSFRTKEEKIIAPVSMMDTTKKVMIVQGYLIASKGNNKSVVIRMDGAGTSSNGQKPLFILDGEVISESVMKVIDPNKIESINILKDASAIAVFGEKGKGGVVQITTKKGGSEDAAATGRIVVRGDRVIANSRILEEGVVIISDTVQLNGKTVLLKSNNLKDVRFMENSLKDIRFVERSTVEAGKKSGVTFSVGSDFKESPSLIFVDGEKKTKKEMDALSPDQIKSVEILKGESAIKAYGAEAKDGVIKITTKKKVNL